MNEPNTNLKRQSTDSSTRMGISIALAVLFGIALLAANHAAWLTTTILDTDSFVATFEPLPQDEAVSLALANKIADAVIESYEVSDVISEALPDGIAFIAVPLTDGVRDLTAGIAAEIIRSDAFSTVWTAALAASHKIATLYVGAFDDGVLKAEDGVAVLDLTAVGAQISENLGGRGFGLLEGADRELTVELFELPDSGMVKFVVNLMHSIRWVVFLITIGFLALAVAVATNRRRIAMWVGGATVLAMLLSLIDMRYLRVALTGDIEDPILKAGAEAAWDIVFRRFVWQSWVVLLLGAVVVFAAWAMGDSAGAVSMRAAAGGTNQSFRGRGQESPAMVFVVSHRRLIEWGTVAVVIGFLLIAPPPPLWVVVVGISLAVAIIAGVEYISARVPEEQSATERPS
ncbi:MAG: hypothetical protein BMS9Abin12_0353 [Acidimicrobiia bacterium]|nr:MAG: hypothetical protein BMS9Abin12_0353 [Acidimicrobiia bacterium]